jgi:hypothetical protein
VTDSDFCRPNPRVARVRIREGKHGARSIKQAIAIGLSKARRAGVHLPAPGRGQSKETRKNAKRDLAAGRHPKKRVSSTRSRATVGAPKREGREAASSSALARQASSAARRRSTSSARMSRSVRNK